jgi:hypothetical protein
MGIGFHVETIHVETIHATAIDSMAAPPQYNEALQVRLGRGCRQSGGRAGGRRAVRRQTPVHALLCGRFTEAVPTTAGIHGSCEAAARGADVTPT